MKDIQIYSRVSLTEILEILTDRLDPDELFEFIKMLDLSVADWDFTQKLSFYFNEEVERCEQGMVQAILNTPEL